MTNRTYKIKWKYIGPLEGEITLSVEDQAFRYSCDEDFVRKSIQRVVEHHFQSLSPVPVEATNIEEVVKLWKTLERKVAIDWS